MKVLIVGASGMIGGEALIQCLAHPIISSVVAFVRRDLPTDVSGHPKLQCILVRDFAIWPKNILQVHADATAMIWAMGTYNGSLTADLEYPLAFLESMAHVLVHTELSRPRFRYVLLSGKFVRRDQGEKLWWGNKPRKIKGLLETKALAFAEGHSTIWETFIVRPGGVVPGKIMASGALGVIPAVGAVLGKNWTVSNEELGAFMVYLAINGDGEDHVIENARIMRKGRELLESQKGKCDS
ncbi:hypothetical protein F5Y06DRAFT_286948 [Hypoxylon sp. FL0890]|nr:hypothetical protein F5Y06DRAFT_286948 [Hypoxylon sp. FL0890]